MKTYYRFRIRRGFRFEGLDRVEDTLSVTSLILVSAGDHSCGDHAAERRCYLDNYLGLIHMALITMQHQVVSLEIETEVRQSGRLTFPGPW
jgi:hypothetical protein